MKEEFGTTAAVSKDSKRSSLPSKSLIEKDSTESLEADDGQFIRFCLFSTCKVDSQVAPWRLTWRRLRAWWSLTGFQTKRLSATLSTHVHHLKFCKYGFTVFSPQGKQKEKWRQDKDFRLHHVTPVETRSTISETCLANL